MALRPNSRVQFDKAWWRKEVPEGLVKDKVKEFAKFAEAMDDFGGAERRLDIQSDDDQLSATDLAELKKAKAALLAIDKPRKALLDYSERLVRDVKDKKAREPYDVLIKVLKVNVPAAVDDMAELLDSYDGDPVGAPMVTPESHAAYLKRLMPRLKRLPYNFGFALVSNEPNDQRFNFHHKKAPRSLAQSLKNDVKPRVLTWGTARAGNIFEGGAYPAATLVLELQGKKVPSFARRVRLMLKALGLSLFNNVVVVSDGQVLEEAAAEDDDRPLEEVAAEDFEDIDFDTETVVKSGVAPEEHARMQAAEIPAPPPPGGIGSGRLETEEDRRRAADARTAAQEAEYEKMGIKPLAEKPERSEAEKNWIRIRKDIAGRVERCISTKHKPWENVKKIWILANSLADDGNFAGAHKAARKAEALLAGFDPPPEPVAEEWLRKRDLLAPQMKACFRERKGNCSAMGACYAMSELLAESGNHAEALKYLNALAKYIADKDKPVESDIPKDPVERRQYAKDLYAKLMAMQEDLEDAVANFVQKEARTVKENNHAVSTALGSDMGGFNKDFVETGKARYDFDTALIGLDRLEGVLRKAKKEGRKQTKVLRDIRDMVSELDGTVSGLSEHASNKAIKPLFKKQAVARARFAKFLRKDDLYGAHAKIAAWQAAVDRLVDGVETL